jgi:hypothetical protein
MPRVRSEGTSHRFGEAAETNHVSDRIGRGPAVADGTPAIPGFMSGIGRGRAARLGLGSYVKR